MKNRIVSHKRPLIAAAIALAGFAGLGVCSTQADVFTATGVGTADFSFINGNTQLQVVVTNTGSNTLQGTAISGLEFNAAGFTLGSLSSATATNGLISSPYTTVVTLGADILTADGGRWHTVAGPASDPNELLGLGGGQPSEMIISNSISSNGGTNNFDPYVYEVGTFIYNVSNVGASPTFADANGHVVFLLGTGPDSTVSTGCADCGGAGAPEPASLGVLGLGAAGLLIRRRRK